MADRSRLPVSGPDASFRFPSIIRSSLPNGIRLCTAEHPGVPVVTFVVQVEGGSGADPGDLEGLAAVTADMVDEGTGQLSAIDISEALARIGADYDADVGADATTFALTTLTRFAERGASLLADLVIRPSLREADFTRVRQLRLDRLRQLKDLPPAVAERSFLRLLYDGHPYGHLAIGSEAALRALTLSDVRRFHASTCQPKRCTLVVVGALSHDELTRLAVDAFGGWANAAEDGDAPVRASELPPPAHTPARLAIVPRAGAAQSELRIGYLATRRDTPDYPALVVMNAVLGGQFVSRIMTKLREERGFTYGARTGFDWRRGLGPFSMQSSVHTASTVDAIRDAIAEIGALRGERPATPDELVLAKASLTRGYPRNFETAQQVARSVAQIALYGLSSTYFEEFVPLVSGVTEAQVRDVADRYLDPSRMTTLIVGDHAVIGDALPSLGLGAPTILPVE
jgi:predicted Zn-dependent peptidase